MSTVVSMDGTVVTPEQATVSVFDRGFLYGDSVYEVVRTYRGVPFELEAHLSRLESSADRIAMEIPFPRSLLAEETLSTHRASGNSDSYLRIVVTRGAGKIGLDIALAEDPRRLVIAQPLDKMRPPPEAYTDGVEVALVGVGRNLRETLDPQAKTGNYLNSVMALAEARRRGAHEAIMIDRRDFITEGASSNVFAVVKDVLLTPPIDAGILEGVTRSVVLRVARAAGLRVLELPINANALRQADEVFITSSIREIVPVVRVDGEKVGVGQPGPTTARIVELFADYVEQHISRHVSD